METKDLVIYIYISLKVSEGEREINTMMKNFFRISIFFLITECFKMSRRFRSSSHQDLDDEIRFFN